MPSSEQFHKSKNDSGSRGPTLGKAAGHWWGCDVRLEDMGNSIVAASPGFPFHQMISFRTPQVRWDQSLCEVKGNFLFEKSRLQQTVKWWYTTSQGLELEGMLIPIPACFSPLATNFLVTQLWGELYLETPRTTPLTPLIFSGGWIFSWYHLSSKNLLLFRVGNQPTQNLVNKKPEFEQGE